MGHASTRLQREMNTERFAEALGADGGAALDGASGASGTVAETIVNSIINLIG